MYKAFSTVLHRYKPLLPSLNRPILMSYKLLSTLCVAVNCLFQEVRMKLLIPSHLFRLLNKVTHTHKYKCEARWNVSRKETQTLCSAGNEMSSLP